MRLDQNEIDALAEAMAPLVAELVADRLAVLLKPSTKDFLTLAEAAAEWGVPRHVIRDAVASRKLVAHRPGKSWRIRREDLFAWAHERAREACA